MKRVVVLLFTFSWSFVCAVHRKGQHQILRTNHKSFPNKSEKPNPSSEEGMSKFDEGASKSEEDDSKPEDKCKYYGDDGETDGLCRSDCPEECQIHDYLVFGDWYVTEFPNSSFSSKRHIHRISFTVRTVRAKNFFVVKTRVTLGGKPRQAKKVVHLVFFPGKKLQL